MEFISHISDTNEGQHRIYGTPVEELMQHASYTEVIFLLLAGRMPNAGERALLDAMLVGSSEHGVEAPSLYAPRVSVASGNPVHVGIASGVLAIGESHGGAGEAAVRLLMQDTEPSALVSHYLERKERMPGFGHKVYKEVDPRAHVLYQKAQEAQLPLHAFTRAFAIEAELEKQKGKKLPLNIDGAFAASVIALGLPPEAAKALFVVGRVSGMAAHAIEEARTGAGYHRLTDTK